MVTEKELSLCGMYGELSCEGNLDGWITADS